MPRPIGGEPAKTWLTYIESLEARVTELEARDAGWDYDVIKAERDRYREALDSISLGHDDICCCVSCNALRND